MTEPDWRHQLAAVHPDGQTPDGEAFRAIVAARWAWDKGHGVCAHCGRVFVLRPNHQAQKYCCAWCANQAIGEHRRKPKSLPATACVEHVWVKSGKSWRRCVVCGERARGGSG